MNKTISLYIFKMQLKTMCFVSISVFFLILLFDFTDIARRYPISNIHEVIFSIKLSLLRTPLTFSTIMHYTYFIAAIFNIWNLCKSHQLTVLKSIGRSPQQILYPFFSYAVFIAIIWLFIIHPAGLFYEKQYTKLTHNKLANNVWIDYPKDNKIIFIKTLNDNKINTLCIFDIKHNSKIFAQNALIKKTSWQLNNAITISDVINNFDKLTIPNVVPSNLIRLLSKAPKDHNIYSLYKIYSIQKKTKINLKSYELELHKLLINCFSFILFALVAAVICFPVNRYKTKTNIAIQGISFAILLRFVNNVLESIAHANAIPIHFACWSVSLILTCAFTSILIWREV